VWSDLAVLLKRAIADLKFKVRHCIRELAYLCNNFVRGTSADDTATESATSFYLVNLMLLVFLILLSPDKIPQMLVTNQPDFAIFDRIEEISTLLKRAISL
jgi:hypothetical protein